MPIVDVSITNTRLAGVNPYVPGSIVGADPWNDLDAGTYTEATASERTFSGVNDGYQEARADLAVPADVATITQLTLVADLTSINTGGTGPRHAVNAGLYSPAGEYLASFTGLDALTGGVLETVTTDTLTTGPDLSWVLPALDGGYINLSRYGNSGSVPPADFTLRCHRLVLTIDYQPAATTPYRTRRYPRDDTAGLGSASRLHPPPRGRRTVGGYT